MPGECLDDAMLIPDTFQLVLLAYPPADWEEDQKLSLGFVER